MQQHEPIFRDGHRVAGFAVGDPNVGVDGLLDVVTGGASALVKGAGSLVRGATGLITKGGAAIAKGATSAASAAAHAASSAAHAASSAVHAVESLPVVGDAMRFAGNAAATPIQLTESIASGKRLDHALEGEFKRQLKIVKDAAPYAQTVLSLVPGAGSGVSAAVAAGIALSEGRDIDDAAKAAIRSAIPGGAAAGAVFDTALKVGSGENVTKSVLESARNAVPANFRPAFDVGLAVATGEKVQNALARGLADSLGSKANEIIAQGTKAISSNPALSNALSQIKDAAPQEGFKLGAGLITTAGINAKAVRAVRNKLDPAQRTGFDAALRSQAGDIRWIDDIVRPPPTLTSRVPKQAPPTLTSRVPKQAPPKLAATPAAKVAVAADKAILSATGPAAPALQAAVNGEPPFTPYPQGSGVAGLGAFLEPERWRWFAVYNGNQPISHRGPVRLSDSDALLEEAGFVESTQGRPYVGTVYRWDWDGTTWRQAHRGRSSGLSGCGGAPCQSFGPAITEMGSDMRYAGLSAVNATHGRPRMVSAPDGTDYRFALENGVLTARECLR